MVYSKTTFEAHLYISHSQVTNGRLILVNMEPGTQTLPVSKHLCRHTSKGPGSEISIFSSSMNKILIGCSPAHYLQIASTQTKKRKIFLRLDDLRLLIVGPSSWTRRSIPPSSAQKGIGSLVWRLLRHLFKERIIYLLALTRSVGLV